MSSYGSIQESAYPSDRVSSCMGPVLAEGGLAQRFRSVRNGAMQHPGFDFRRISLLGTWVNSVGRLGMAAKEKTWSIEEVA